ncbi:MAG: TM1266 family iron-only hydrogenase system putative regulator [Hydrogeniiclostridium sp.]
MDAKTTEETRIALVGIIVEDMEQTEKINQILHIYGSYIIGRMGVPYRQRMVSIISIVLDAPNSVISALSGKLGMLPGVQTKTIYSKV